ncbi:MAG: lysophospholipid acyltransferase family protein [Blastocatellia bacterium]|nr:lysophospholipid acyltransferase family protein [Blastocatellia bacterium]
MAKKSKAQIYAEFVVVKAVFGFLNILPRRAAVGAGLFLARILYHLLSPLRRAASRNLEIAFSDLTEPERKRLAKGAFDNLGRMLGEISQFPKATPESISQIIDFRFDPATLARYEELRLQGRGVIILSPHMGNWELLVFAWAAAQEPISYLARPLDNPLIEDLTVKLRTRFGNRPINKTNAVGNALSILRAGGILGILADVNAHPKEGVFVPFFGVPACTSTGPALLAMRSNAVIIPVTAVWVEEEGRYVARHGSIIEPRNTGDRQADVAATTAEFTAEVEALIRQNPDQWMWVHKRWKTRPPGEPDIYEIS